MSAFRLAERAVQAAFVVLLFLGWHLATARGAVSPLLLPPLPEVGREFVALLRSGAFWPDLRVTLSEFLLAFALAAVAGIVVGCLVGRSRYAVQVFDPMFAALYSIPTIVFFPLYVLFFGVGAGSKVAMGATMAFFPVVLSTTSGLQQVRREYVAAARSMGASPLRMFWRVMLPAAFPAVFAGLRIGLTLAFLAVLGTEMLVSLAGLGHRIVESAESMDSVPMFAYIALAMLPAALLHLATSWAGARAQGEA